jgi:CBS domain-containing protein
MGRLDIVEVKLMATARTIMTTDVLYVTKDTDIYEAIQFMIDGNVTGLPVVDKDHKLVGIVTEKDVLRLLYNAEDGPGTVERFMSPDVVSFDQDDDLRDVVARFQGSHFRRVPILNDGRLVGIVSRKDIIRYIRKQQPAEAGERTACAADELYWG